MKRVVLAALVAVGILFPVTFSPAQRNGPKNLAAEPKTEAPTLQVDTIVIQIMADADSVVAVPDSVTVSHGHQ